MIRELHNDGKIMQIKLEKNNIMLKTGFSTLGFIREKQQNKKGDLRVTGRGRNERWLPHKMIDWQFYTLLHTNQNAVLKPSLHSPLHSLSPLLSLADVNPPCAVTTNNNQPEEASRWGFMLHASVSSER